MTKKKRYKRYSPEFKREALMRPSEEGVTDVIDFPAVHGLHHYYLHGVA